MQVKSKSGRTFNVPDADETRKIRAGIAADEDAVSLDEFKRLRPVGRPKAAVTKQPISIRLSPEVVDYFKSTGQGWQTRLDAVLREYVASRQ